jgi:hypothetical protein
MFQRNSLPLGLAIGILLPLAGFGILYLLYQGLDMLGVVSSEGLSHNFRLRTIGIVAIALNALPMNRAFKKRLTQTMRGITIATFVFVVIWLVFFGRSVL